MSLDPSRKLFGTPIFLLVLTMLFAARALADSPAARLEWAEVVPLSSPLSGRIDTIRVKPGERVKQGQILATLDARPYKAELKRARAVLRGLKSRADEARRELDRARELFERTVLSKTDLQQAEIDFDLAEGNWLRARAELEKAEIDLEYTRIRAPFSGVVAAIEASPGEVIVNRCQATPVVRLARGGRWLARFSFAGDSGLRVGDAVTLLLDAEALNGRVGRIHNADRNVGIVEVVVDKEGELAGKLVKIQRP